MPKQPAKVNQLLLQQRSITQLLQKKTQHEVFLNRVKQVLPLTMSSQCIVCVSQGNILTLYAKTAAWAAQVRYYELLMLEHLNNSSTDTHFEKIQVRIQPCIQQIKIKPKKISRPSSATIKAIRVCALGYPPGKLKQSLLRLTYVLKKGKGEAKPDLPD